MEPIKKREVVSVQVIPVDASDPVEVVPQFAGPDKDTTGWGVYARSPDGTVEWIIDSPDEATAMMLGATLAEAHGVRIEEQPWKRKAA